MENIGNETIYFWILVVCAFFACLLMLIGDIFEGPVDPMLVIPWVAFTALFGFIGERYTEYSSLIILSVGLVISTILVFLLNFYVLVPLKNADSTLSSSEKDLEGRVATVVTPIPEKGMGEIRYESVTGSVNRPASLYEKDTKEIKAGEKVLTIEIRDRVSYVVPYSEEFQIKGGRK